MYTVNLYICVEVYTTATSTATTATTATATTATATTATTATLYCGAQKESTEPQQQQPTSWKWSLFAHWNIHSASLQGESTHQNHHQPWSRPSNEGLKATSRCRPNLKNVQFGFEKFGSWDFVAWPTAWASLLNKGCWSNIANRI